MNWVQFIGAVELGLIFSLIALAVYISFRTLQFPDMTVDGSFPLGAAVCATMITVGFHPLTATFAAFLAGSLAGLLTAWMSTHLRMLNLLAGILTMTALYSINIRIMGRPNIALLGERTLMTECFNCLYQYTSNHAISLFFIVLLFFYFVYLFFRTRLGLALRAAGSNPRMSRAQGINDHRMIWLGLSLSNALVGLAGALFAQAQGFADVSMGVGTIVIGLAAVIIGEALIPIRTVKHALVACLFGAILYRFVIATALNVGDFGFQASDLNFVTAVLVACAMLIPSLKQRVKAFS